MPSKLNYDPHGIGAALAKHTLSSTMQHQYRAVLFLNYMQDLNEENSPGGFSQFPSETRDDFNVSYGSSGSASSVELETLPSYDPSKATQTFQRYVKPSTVLICERCETHYDVDFNVLQREELDELNPRFCTLEHMSWVHCRLRHSTCAYNTKDNWKRAQTAFLAMKRKSNESVGQYLDEKCADCRNDTHGPNRQISHHISHYHAVRNSWYGYLVCQKNCIDAGKQCSGWNPDVVPWGDLFTDFDLCRRHPELISEQGLTYLYDLDAKSIEYLHHFMGEWKDEVSWINDYAGARRLMSDLQFTRAKRAAQRVGAAMRKLVLANEMVAENCTMDNVQARDQAILVARSRFREVQSAVVAVPAVRRIEVQPKKTSSRHGGHCNRSRCR